MDPLNAFKIPQSKLPNFIKKIRFPLFKKITPEAEIIFNYGFTVFVGANGCGKSSALQALYGCPKGKNTGDYWFSTNIDPIIENRSGPYRYMYQYHIDELKKDVWVTNTRAKRKNNIHRRDNPDYWETAKPAKRDGLEPLPTEYQDKEEPYRNKTRWNPVKKEVIYIDFRSELSAFDKCFNFGSFRKTENIHSIQDFIRHRSRQVKAAFSNKKPASWHSRSNTQVNSIDAKALSEISKILGKEYTEAEVMRHNYYGSKGLSIIFREKNNSYSEALAGSGEVAIATCVIMVTSAPKGSLILLDEPEVSLHPGAQREFKNFLLRQIAINQHQIVMCTHSPYFIENLPKDAIKLFHPNQANDNTFNILNCIHPDDAFCRLGVVNSEKHVIYVEDILAKALIEKVLIDKSSIIEKDNFEIVIYPGGHQAIKNNLLPYFCNTNAKKELVFLDGDAKAKDDVILDESPNNSTTIKSPKILNSEDIPANSTSLELKEILKSITGQEIKLPLNSNISEDNKKNIYLNAINMYERKFFFGNTETPEELLWNVSKRSIEFDEKHNNYKSKFHAATMLEIGTASSDEIFYTQKTFIKKIDVTDIKWMEFAEIIEDLIEKIRS